jgi:hypothetical protein
MHHLAAIVRRQSWKLFEIGHGAVLAAQGVPSSHNCNRHLGKISDRYPIVPDLDVGSLHGRPGNAMSDFFLPRVVGVRCKRMIESLAIDVLRMVWQMVPNRSREVLI